MAELLIVLMMAFNLWMVIYLTWERREENVPKEDKEKDVGAPERSGDIMGKSLFRMPERKPQAAAPMSNATVQAPGEEVDGDDDGEPHEAGGMTFEDIDLAMRTVKKPKATKEERRHAGMVFCDMKGNELFAMIEKSSEATRRKLDELMDYYLDSVSAAQANTTPVIMPKKAPAVPDNFEDFNIRDYV